MKRIVIMLLIACSVITTASADPTATAPQKKPENVIRIMNTLIDKFGAKERQIYSVNRNPNTGTIESSLRSVTFYCDAPGSYIPQVVDCFTKDEPLSYQFMHLAPHSEQQVIVDVLSQNGQNIKVHVRTPGEELWFMCTKNPENPQLRDVYAISWKYVENRKVASGSVYMITSLRPDLYQKNMSSAGLLSDNKNTFTIDGRVGYDLKDSLYVVYMADTAEELNNLKDSDFVATMPVVNKRFTFSVELDKPKVGRIRTVMPDGSLCELWTNLDFVPGETYRITTHNGYYDEDRDYEQRVGRYSGKSLLNERQSRGIDDMVVDDGVADDVMVVDDVEIDTIPGYSEPVTPRQSSRWEPTPEQKMQVEAKAMALKANMDAIKATYASLEPHFKMKSLTGSDRIFEQITKLNKELDAKFQDFIKYLKGLDVPPTEIVEKNKAIGEIHKEILKFYTEQNQGFTEMYKEVGVLTKAARKTQKYINGLTEKYLKEMSKAVMGAK